MAWNTPTSTTINQQVTHTFWNQQIPDNFNAAFPDAISANDWTPSLSGSSSDPTVTTSDGAECVVGAVQFAWGRFVSITDVGSGNWYFTLPATASGITAASGTTDQGQCIGSALAYADSTSDLQVCSYVVLRTTTTAWFGDKGDYPWGSATSPLIEGWTSDTQLAFTVCYPISS